MVDDYENGAEERFSPDVDNEVCTISPDDMKIHGLLVNNDDDAGIPMLLVPMETLDNQIDFNILKVLRKPPGDDFEY